MHHRDGAARAPSLGDKELASVAAERERRGQGGHGERPRRQWARRDDVGAKRDGPGRTPRSRSHLYRSGRRVDRHASDPARGVRRDEGRLRYLLEGERAGRCRRFQ